MPGFNYGMLEKPVFSFFEQSHYALTLGFLVVALVWVSGKLEAVFYISNMVCLSLIFPNLTLLVFCLLSAVFFARIRILYLIPLFVCFSVFLYLSLCLLLIVKITSHLDWISVIKLILQRWCGCKAVFRRC